MEINKIEQLFAVNAIIRPGTFLFKPIDAIEFLNECQKKETNILGVDVFYLIEEKVQPALMHRVDFSSSGRHEMDINVYDEARKLIEAANDMYFEIIIDC